MARLAQRVSAGVTEAAAAELFEPSVKLLAPGKLRAGLLANLKENKAAFLRAVKEHRFVFSWS